MSGNRTVIPGDGSGALEIDGHALTISNARFEPPGEVVCGEEVTFVVDVKGEIPEGAEVTFKLYGFAKGSTRPEGGVLHEGTGPIEAGVAKLAWTPSLSAAQLKPATAFTASTKGSNLGRSKVVPLCPAVEVKLDDGRGGEAPTAIGTGEERGVRINPEGLPKGFFRFETSGGGRVLVTPDPKTPCRAILRGQLASEAEEDVKLKAIFVRDGSKKTYEFEHTLTVFDYALEVCLHELPPPEGEEENPLSVEPAGGGDPLAKDAALNDLDLTIAMRDDNALTVDDLSAKGILGASCAESKPANFASNGWIDALQPQVPVRVSFQRKLRGGTASAIEADELKVRIALRDPATDHTRQANADVQSFFTDLDTLFAHPTPERGNNAPAAAGGLRKCTKTSWIHKRFSTYDGSDPAGAVAVELVPSEESKAKNHIELSFPASTTDSGAHRSDLHLLFKPALLAGESYRFELEAGEIQAKTGTWTFWKRLRLDKLVRVASKLEDGATAWDQESGLDEVISTYREAFIDLELPTDEQRHTLTEEEWKSTVQGSLSDQGIATEDEGYEFGSYTLPNDPLGAPDPAPHEKDYDEAVAAMKEAKAHKDFAEWKRLRASIKKTKADAAAAPEDEEKQAAYERAKTRLQTLADACGTKYCDNLAKARAAWKSLKTARAAVKMVARKVRRGVIEALIAKAPGEPKGFSVYLGPALSPHWTSLNGTYLGDGNLAFFDKGQGEKAIIGTLIHELGHGLYLRHSVTKPADRSGKDVTFKGETVGKCIGGLTGDPCDHDPTHALKCVMSYTRDRQGEQVFCGFCQLILRFWNRDNLLKLGAFRRLVAERAPGLEVASASFKKDGELAAAPTQLFVEDKAGLLLLSTLTDERMRLNLSSFARWKSSSAEVLSVSASGRLTAKAVGTAKITASIGTQKVELSIAVAAKQAQAK